MLDKEKIKEAMRYLDSNDIKRFSLSRTIDAEKRMEILRVVGDIKVENIYNLNNRINLPVGYFVVSNKDFIFIMKELDFGTDEPEIVVDSVSKYGHEIFKQADGSFVFLTEDQILITIDPKEFHNELEEILLKYRGSIRTWEER